VITYLTKDGDTADYIAWKHYGTTDNLVVEQLLNANVGLADRGPVLPAGVVINLPEITPSSATSGVKLWD